MADTIKDIKDLVIEGYKQLDGREGLDVEENFDLVSVGKEVLSSSTSKETFTNALVNQIASIEIMTSNYKDDLAFLVVPPKKWGAFRERAYFKDGDIITDPSTNLLSGTSYADIEHTFYGSNVIVSLFDNECTYMLPVSLPHNAVRLERAFTSMSEMESYIGGIRSRVQITLQKAWNYFKHGVLCDGIAMAMKKNSHEVKLLTEYNTIKGLELTETEALASDDFKEYALERIRKVRKYLSIDSNVYNNGNVNWATYDADGIFLTDFVESVRTSKANIYNPQYIGFDESTYHEVASWQAIKDGADVLDYDTVSTIKMAADENNKLGCGTDAFTLENVVGMLFDKRYMGASENIVETNSTPTNCASFTNYFFHRNVEGIVDDNLNAVVFTLN